MSKKSTIQVTFFLGRLLLLVVALSAFAADCNAQNVPDKVVRSFEKGDSKALSDYLHKSVEMNILDQKHVASKNQAVRILQDFFDDNPPTSFKVTYESAKTDSKYSVCSYISGKKNYTINMSILEEDKESHIYYLSIEIEK